MRVTIPEPLLLTAIEDRLSTDSERPSADEIHHPPILCGRRLDDGDVLQGVGVWTPPPADGGAVGTRTPSQLGTRVEVDELAAQSQYYQLAPDETVEALVPIITAASDASNFLEGDGTDAVLVVERTHDGGSPPDDMVRLETAAPSSEDRDTAGGDVDIIRYEADAFSRNKSLLDSEVLTDRVVTVVGLGTGGATAAVELAKAGVGSFRLVDFDRLETHNITRHVCGLSDVGRKKTQAVRDRLLAINPTVDVSTLDIDVVEDTSAARDTIKGSDVVIGATDSEVSKLAINRICVEAGVPAIYAGAYERAFGGDVIRVIPGETPCYDCVLGDLQESMDYTDETESIDYAEVENPENFTAEPGLSTDVGFISLLQTKYALLTLLRGTDSALEDYDEHMCFWGNRPEWIFEEPLQSQFAETRFRDDCPTCQREAYFEETLGMTEAEARKKAQDIVADVEEMEIPGRNESPPGEGNSK